jgi:hypothetical protein
LFCKSEELANLWVQYLNCAMIYSNYIGMLTETLYKNKKSGDKMELISKLLDNNLREKQIEIDLDEVVQPPICIKKKKKKNKTKIPKKEETPENGKKKIEKMLENERILSKLSKLSNPSSSDLSRSTDSMGFSPHSPKMPVVGMDTNCSFEIVNEERSNTASPKKINLEKAENEIKTEEEARRVNGFEDKKETKARELKLEEKDKYKELEVKTGVEKKVLVKSKTTSLSPRKLRRSGRLNEEEQAEVQTEEKRLDTSGSENINFESFQLLETIGAGSFGKIFKVFMCVYVCFLFQ